MANSLLDFVMTLVRDPDAAARFAENPDQAISDAHLINVTGADVNNLIPVVAESLSSAVPTTGHDIIAGDMAHNVWASGAATAAFDAFDDHVPIQVHPDTPGVISDNPDVSFVVDHPAQVVDDGLGAFTDAGVPGVVGADDTSIHFDDPVVHDVHDTWHDTVHTVGNLHDGISDPGGGDSDPSGLDIF
jgi:hypothetical protein